MHFGRINKLCLELGPNLNMAYNGHAFPQWEETTAGFQSHSACAHLSRTTHTFVVLGTQSTLFGSCLGSRMY